MDDANLDIIGTAGQDEQDLLQLASAENGEAVLDLIDEAALKDVLERGRGFVFGLRGHGLCSWEFRLVLKTARVSFDFSLPALQVLGSEAWRIERAEDLRAVCRLVGVALHVTGKGPHLEAFLDDRDVCVWRRTEIDGGTREGQGWGGLLSELESMFDSEENVICLWP